MANFHLNHSRSSCHLTNLSCHLTHCKPLFTIFLEVVGQNLYYPWQTQSYVYACDLMLAFPHIRQTGSDSARCPMYIDEYEQDMRDIHLPWCVGMWVCEPSRSVWTSTKLMELHTRICVSHLALLRVSHMFPHPLQVPKCEPKSSGLFRQDQCPAHSAHGRDFIGTARGPASIGPMTYQGRPRRTERHEAWHATKHGNEDLKVFVTFNWSL